MEPVEFAVGFAAGSASDGEKSIPARIEPDDLRHRGATIDFARSADHDRHVDPSDRLPGLSGPDEDGPEERKRKLPHGSAS
jgi:hypothetical protein